MEVWNGFECEKFVFDGKNAIAVLPKKANGGWLIKTEYWGAFPALEIEMLKRGYALAYIENETRFATFADCKRKSEFAYFMAEKYGLSGKCIPIGYSCGGAHAVNFAGFFPENVCCMLIDAPVLNFCDYPGRLPADRCEGVWENEFVKAYPGVTRAGLLDSFLFHPLNRIKALQENQIPIIMLYGTEDKTVNYKMNGRLLELEYEKYPDLLTVIPREYQGHHPHGTVWNMGGLADLLCEKSRG